MSNKYIKISANQQQFSSSLNNVDFTIPEGMNVDLSKSKLLVNIVPAHTQPTANLPGDDGLASVYEVGMKVQDGGIQLQPATGAVLVKNVHMKAQRSGLIESIRRVDVLRAGLANYTKDVDEKMSLATNGLIQTPSADGSQSSPFVNYVKTGTQLSQQIPDADISVPLNEILDVCNASAYSTDKHGQTHLHLEMNFDKLQIAYCNTTTDATVANLDASAFAGFTTQTSTADGTTVVSATSNKATNNPEQDFPFYVGQRVVISANIAGAGNADFKRRIESITYAPATGLSTINFTNSLGTIDDTQTCVFASIKPEQAGADPTFTINNCELELKLTDEEPPAEIQYTTYSTEEDSFPNTQSKNKMYQVEPNADNLIVALTNGGLLPDHLLSTYRFRVDNKEQSNNAVKIDEPEHHDNINKLFLNMDLELKDISERAFDLEKDKNKTDSHGLRLGFIGTPLPITQNQKNVNLEITAGANMSELMLFKRMVKSI